MPDNENLPTEPADVAAPPPDLAAYKAMTVAERRSKGVRYAGEGESYPIRPGHPKDVRNAWNLAGHAANPDEVRKNIRRIASELGMSDALPDTAKESGGKAWPRPSDGDLVFVGGAVKALGSGKVGGIVAPYATPETADLQGDFFHPATDFGLDVTDKARVIYHHGFSKSLGPRKLGVAALRHGAAGLEGEAVLNMADMAAAEVYGRAEKGELFWSSGSAERLVVRTEVKGRNRIDEWPILEISLTPNPVDRRARAVALKALMDADAGLGYDDSPRDAGAAMAALQQLASSLCSAVCGLMCGDEEGVPPGERDARIRAEFADFSEDGLAVVMALIGGDGAAAKAILSSPHETRRTRRAAAAPTLAEFSDRLVADATELMGLFRKAHEQRRAGGRHLSPAKLDAVKALAATFARLEREATPPPSPEAVRAMRIRLMRAGLASQR